MRPLSTLDAVSPGSADAWAYRRMLAGRQNAGLTPDQQAATAAVTPTGPPTAPGVPPGLVDKTAGLAPPVDPNAVRPPRTLSWLDRQSGIINPGDVTGPVTTDPNAPVTPGSGSTPADPRFGTTPRTDMGSGTAPTGYRTTGFDVNQDPNNRLIGKSAKYTTLDAARVAEESGAGDVWKTKEGAQFFAEKYLKPKLEEAGFEVLDIRGDKMFVRDHEDRAAGRPGSWIDFVVGADGDNPALAWQVENAGSASQYAQEKKHASRISPATDSATTTDPATSPVVPDPTAGPTDPVYQPLARKRPNWRPRALAALGVTE